MNQTQQEEIERIVEEFEDKFCFGFVKGSPIHLDDHVDAKEAIDWLRTTLTSLTEAHKVERKRAEQLWTILDDIDSLPDLIHPNTPQGHENCWRQMVEYAKGRHEILKTDGYKLFNIEVK